MNLAGQLEEVPKEQHKERVEGEGLGHDTAALEDDHLGNTKVFNIYTIYTRMQCSVDCIH